jgi:hypothetical protein
MVRIRWRRAHAISRQSRNRLGGKTTALKVIKRHVKSHRVDGLSERTALPLSAEMRRWSDNRVGPGLPTCVVQQVVSYLGYSGRGANAFGKAAYVKGFG